MSGIGGLFRRDNSPVDSLDLSAVLARLVRRGPDASAVWQRGPVGLAQTLLRSTPESLLERQPLVSASGDQVLVMDGRIDNRSDLIPRLDLRGLPEREIPDSQIVLAAFQKWGVDCLPRLLGDFAFAVWDASANQLFCARDVFGVKPFYYYSDPRCFVFGSEIKALLALPFVPRGLNETALAEFMLEVFDDRENTFYTHIHRLPPASYLIVTPGDFHIRSYWQLDGEREIRLKTDAEYAEAYRDLFVDAVRVRLRSAYPVGSALSGGLDSSSITCVAGSLLSGQGLTIDTFSTVFDRIPQSDERPYIQAVLNQGSYQSHFVYGDQTAPVESLPALLSDQDQPFYAPNLFMSYQLWDGVAGQGVRVFLEGLFGDNVISHGFGWLTELARTWRIWELYRQVRQYAGVHPDGASTGQLMKEYLYYDSLKSNLSPAVLAFYRRLRGRPVDPLPAVPLILDPDFVRRLSLQQRLQAVAVESSQATTARKIHLQELNYGLIPTGLEIYSAGSATFSLDPRFPYLDRRLVEFCLAVPGNQKLNSGYSRMIARRGLEGYLPEAIRWRPGKGDLSYSLNHLLKKEQEQLNDLFSSSERSLRGYLNLEVLQKWTGRVTTGQGTDHQVLSVYLVAMLAYWLNSKDGVQNGAEGGGFYPRTATTLSL